MLGSFLSSLAWKLSGLPWVLLREAGFKFGEVAVMDGMQLAYHNGVSCSLTKRQPQERTCPIPLLPPLTPSVG